MPQMLTESINRKLDWSGREDLNLRPLAPHASTLPGCATPRTWNYNKQASEVRNLEIAIAALYRAG